MALIEPHGGSLRVFYLPTDQAEIEGRREDMAHAMEAKGAEAARGLKESDDGAADRGEGVHRFGAASGVSDR